MPNTHLASLRRRAPWMGDIGDNPREVEYEPLTAPATQPEPIPAPGPVEPVRTPEEVPA